eukprot:CAMPEP_0115523124 /NCGR_PEP_ID=MMETSP0271-20121206/80462_1 /TAXON_ID=71861 /ORGANISM="Scrippsiella trochoidea, Strain CCMP3099" /LENGTH=193 /DNA_ID=CAMNT_0002954501 /DNA_START=405 /DNA_END=987 /DNA_ORIENTATION=+
MAAWSHVAPMAPAACATHRWQQAAARIGPRPKAQAMSKRGAPHDRISTSRKPVRDVCPAIRELNSPQIAAEALLTVDPAMAQILRHSHVEGDLLTIAVYEWKVISPGAQCDVACRVCKVVVEALDVCRHGGDCPRSANQSPWFAIQCLLNAGCNLHIYEVHKGEPHVLRRARVARNVRKVNGGFAGVFHEFSK